jgi:DnaJ-class molecular chaperone
MNASTEKNCYDALGVPRTATDDEIKRAYRKLSLKYHPDRNGGNEESTKMFQEISHAYDVIGDRRSRMQYDAELDGAPFGRGGGGHPAEFQDINELFSMLFSGGHGGGVPPNAEMHFFTNMQPGAGFPFANGGGGGMPRGFFPPQMRPDPIVAQIQISIAQAYTGCTVPVEIARWNLSNGVKTAEKETLYLSIPEGIDNNEIIVVQDRGNCIDNQIKGEIKVNIQVANTTEFARSGLDLIFKKTISLKESLCGFSFEMTQLTGKTICINNKQNHAIIRPNYTKVFPEMGMKRDGKTGNLVIVFDVSFPDKLDDAQLEAIRQIL